jgi:hypothetical protein
MKRLITITVLMIFLLAGITTAAEWKFPMEKKWRSKADVNVFDVAIDSSFASTLADGTFIAVGTFSPGEDIYLPVDFFVPNSDNWEVNWIITDGAGTVIFLDFDTEFVAGQTFVEAFTSTTLPAGDYTFTAAVIGRGVEKSAISHQYRFIVR